MDMLLVYGTLRKGGIAANKLAQATFVKMNRQLPGYAMYAAGWYPVVVPEPESWIIVDEVLIPDSLWTALDAYEGEEYRRVWLSEQEAWIYLYLGDLRGLPLVTAGNWLHYWTEKEEGS